MFPFRAVLAVVAATSLTLPAARTPRANRSHADARAAAKPRCAPDNGGLTLPAGFCALVVADNLGQPRHLTVLSNGDIVASSQRAGVIVLRDTSGDGRADIVKEWGGGYRSSEVVLHGGYLYVDATTAILRYPFTVGSLTPSGPADTLISGLPGNGHSAKPFVIADDGTLYMNIGSGTNSCQKADRQLEIPGNDPCVERTTRAGIWAFRTDRLNQHPSDGVHFGAGIRNAMGMAIHPGDNTLFVTQHGRDQLAQNWPKLFDEAKSAETPAEELFNVTKGDDFGWPYCYYDRQIGRKVLAPEYGGDGKTVGRCTSMKGNVASFPGHWAPNGLLFYTGSQFPAKYRNGAFIAFHGSWNRAPLPQAGYNIVFQPLNGDKAAGDFEVFATGFKPAEGTTGTLRRPTGLATGPDGSLYIGDDASGRIWRVMYTGPR